MVDASSGVARGSPRRLTEWRAGGASVGLLRGLWLLSASSDGKRVVLKSDTSHSDIYAARFAERHGRLLDTPRRFTTDERGGSLALGRQTVRRFFSIFGQSGSQAIFTQGLNAESAEPLVVGPGNQVLPRLSSDGQWVLFLEQPASTEPWRIMRVPLAGGRPEQVLDTDGLAFPRCAFGPRTNPLTVYFPYSDWIVDRWTTSFLPGLDAFRRAGVPVDILPYAPAIEESVYPYFPFHMNPAVVERLLSTRRVLVLSENLAIPNDGG